MNTSMNDKAVFRTALGTLGHLMNDRGWIAQMKCLDVLLQIKIYFLNLIYIHFKIWSSISMTYFLPNKCCKKAYGILIYTRKARTYE